MNDIFIKPLEYTITDRTTDSFGTLTIRVIGGNKELKIFQFDEGNWPDALQLHNEIQSAFGQLIGE